MVTHVLAKTTKVKNIFINGKKNFKRILSCLFGGRRKVQVMNLPSRTSSQVVGSAANSVGTTLEFAAFDSGLKAKPSRASLCLKYLETPSTCAYALSDHCTMMDTISFIS